MTAFTIWHPQPLNVTNGAINNGTYQTANSSRKWCKTCGGHILTDHPPIARVDPSAAMLSGWAFTPALHASYVEQVLRLAERLPKMKDFLTEMRVPE